MTTVMEIEEAIEQLPREQFSQIHHWIIEKDWANWDDEIERDASTGRLDFLIREAEAETEAKTIRQF